MKTVLIAILICFSLLIGCSQTNVVKLDEKKETTNTQIESSEPENTESDVVESIGAPVASATGKTPTSCDDTDLNDASVIGKVTVEYNDGTSETYFDNCVSDSNVMQEYLCAGTAVTSKNTICKNACLSVKVADQTTYPGKKVGFCS